MNRHAASVLGFDRLLTTLAGHAATPQGEDACLALAPADSAARARERLSELADFHALVDELGLPPLDGVSRIEADLERARTPGACLDVEALLLIGSTVAALTRLIEYLEDARAEGSPIARHAEGQTPLYSLGTRFARTFGTRGDILDTASPELAAIREEQRRLRGKVLKTLQGILKGPEFDNVVRDDFITERSNRFVIPLTTDFRGYMKGIIHDHSRTGQTVFVEPLEVVETNNRFNRMKEEEEEEIRRILVALTAEVGSHGVTLLSQLALAATIDLLAAKYKFGRRLDCTRPEVSDEPLLNVGAARHPLLALRQGVSVVPIDLRLKEDERLILVTGANAGGKTVALKTAGLIVLMVQSGLYVPCEPGSVVGWFPEVLADIGDEQDIDRDLSTFSAHMARLAEIFDRLCEGALVLLDEMGTGTDPAQGSALAVAVLEEFSASGARVFATTHLDGLKAFVYSAPWAVNAAVAFDPATGKPLYRLNYGHAGTSNALEVAARCGVPERVLDRARSVAGQGGDTVGRILGDLDKALALAREREGQAEKLKVRFEDEVKKQRELVEEARVERRTAREEARREAREMIRRMRELFKETLQKLEAGSLTRAEAQAALEKSTAEVERRFPKPASEAGKPLAPGSVAAGTQVFVASLGKSAEALEAPTSGKVRVRVGKITMSVPVSELFANAGEAAKAAKVQPQTQASVGRVTVEAEKRNPDVVLIGMTVEEALEEFDRALNRALVSGMDSFRVVHGRGSGALRTAIRKRVAHDPKRMRFKEAESDDAVTWVELA